MEEIVFSVFGHGKEALSNLETLLKQFEQEKHIRVRLEVLTWAEGWKQQSNSAIYSSGPDVSYTGSTWVKDLARMNALRPFSPGEIKKITAGKDYFPLSWSGVRSAELEDSQTTWAIPLVSGVRLAYYRRDLLKQAGVDEGTAFQTIPNFENTMAKLKANGHETALAMSTVPANVNLQNLASWIWSSGADFFDAGGTNLTIDSAEALDGIKAYFRLGRYLGNSRLNQEDSDNLFEGGQTAVLMSGYMNVTADIPNQAVRENLGIASVLGTSFVGLIDLIIWHHTVHPEAALALIQYLTRIESGKFLFPSWGLPPYQQGWNEASFKRPDHDTKVEAIQNGRSFPDSRLWALVEKRLSDAIPQIWDAVIANPDESDKIVEETINTLAKRLRMTFAS
jgi:ABC-type glycerol-3-phosphate transport system substrate-binding protein